MHEFFAGFVITEESVLVGEVELAVVRKFWFFGKSFSSGCVQTEKIVQPSFDSDINILVCMILVVLVWGRLTMQYILKLM